MNLRQEQNRSANGVEKDTAFGERHVHGVCRAHDSLMAENALSIAHDYTPLS
jgi:hypothetical protein